MEKRNPLAAGVKFRITSREFALLFENAMDLMFIVDRNGAFLECNPSCYQSFGYQKDELLAMTLHDIVATQYKPLIQGRIRRIMQKGHLLFESAFTRRDGITIPVEVNTTAVTIKRRRVILGIARDATLRKESEAILRHSYCEMENKVQERTTELRRLNESLKKMISQTETAKSELELAKDQAVSASRSKSQFIATISHELRTPLNAIIGFSQILMGQFYGALNEKQGEYVNNILYAGRHLTGLINNILDLSKIESGRLGFTITRVQLRKFLEKQISSIMDEARENNITMSLDIPEELESITFSIDEQKLGQIMFYLHSNAVKFTPPGGVVDTRVRCTESTLVVSVTDTGPGIRKEDQVRIFEEFVQLDQSHTRKHGGTGLGLTLTKRLVEMLGGTIWVKSEGPGKGSTFSFTVPFVELKRHRGGDKS
ncbi:MAG: ATP-binding protein [Candidatus Eremiobacteraeota bacterium]|nr:ATP-binding protein [Candidatus Eremiobacteraeota bacterium]